MDPPKPERWDWLSLTRAPPTGVRLPFDPRWDDPEPARTGTEPTASFNEAERDLFKSSMSDALDQPLPRGCRPTIPASPSCSSFAGKGC